MENCQYCNNIGSDNCNYCNQDLQILAEIASTQFNLLSFIIKCPNCRELHKKQLSREIFIKYECDICMEKKDKFMLLSCGHLLCTECHSRI